MFNAATTQPAPAPIPLRPYPGIGEAFSDLIESMSGIVREEARTELEVSRWVAREMHAATAVEINALVDDATMHIVAGTPMPERPTVVRRLDALRSEVAKQAALAQVTTPRSIGDVGKDIIDGILGIISIVDPDLHEHLGAVGALAARIAIAMGKDSDFADTCKVVGNLHDIGKMAIHRSTLDKSGSLNDVEMAIIRRHADAGYRMVAGIPTLHRYAEGVRSHHERMNGSGYPNHLSGDEICLEARVVAVADVFHAMTSRRCYRESLEPKEAIKEIIRGRGTLYDAAVVDASLRVFGAQIGMQSLAS
jgi:putative nucleotidyltransferase with HDIG domain